MLGVVAKHFIKIELKDPDVIAPVSIAEMEELDSQSCRVLRLIEQQGDDFPGFIDHGKVHGDPALPLDTVPHPDSYDDFPDVTATRLSEEEFEVLWLRATGRSL